MKVFATRVWLVVCCAWLLGAHGTALAQRQELDALDALQTLSYQDSARALAQLEAGAPRWDASPFPEVRRTYFIAWIGALFDAGKVDQAQPAIDQLRALSLARGDDAGLVHAQAAHAHRMATAGKTAEALTLLDPLEPVALRSGDPETVWIYHLVRGSLQNTLGQFESALGSILKSMEAALTRPRQSQAALLRSRLQLGLVYIAMKNGKQALKTIDEAQALAMRLGATQIQGALQLNRGHVESSLGRQDAALRAYQAALKIGNASGLVGLQAAALNNMGDIHLIRKAYALAEPIQRQALARYQAAGEAGGAALAQANLGFALMGQGRIDEGVAHVRTGLRFMRDSGARTMEEVLLEELSRMYEQAGLYREAVETVRAQQVLSKELLRADREQAVATLQARFDAVQRERQIEGLALDNRLKDAEIQHHRLQQRATALGAAGALVAGGFIYLLYRRTRRANRELQAAKRQVDEALQDKSLFLAMASHDLRQPVHAMSMMVEAIGLRNRDAALAPLLQDLKSSMGALNQLFNALLDLSRLEAGNTPSRAVPVDLPSLLGEVVRMFREQAALAGLALRLHLPRHGAVVMADPTLLRQSLVNLTHNAIRYTPRGQVLLAVRRRCGNWQIEVWDTGMGIAPGEQPQVFSPYFRSQQASHRDRTGHGLGLAVVARSAALMGATCGFQSRSGQGSRFWLRLASSHPANGAAPPAAGALPPGSFHALQGRCLVLDDDRQVLAAWQAMLESWGVEARLASTAAEAFEHVDRGFVPAAIFCDQRMHGAQSGFDTLRELLARCPEASGAMVSGELHSAALARAEDEGYLVLRKPLDLEALHAVLDNWLTRPASLSHPSAPTRHNRSPFT